MREAIREARDDLAKGGLRHIGQTEKAVGDCFCMGHHRIDGDGGSVVGLIGLVERKLGLPQTGMLDVMRDAPDNSLWDLFYVELPPNDYDKITPEQTVEAIDRWFAGKQPWVTKSA